MKTYLLDTFNRYKRFSENLDMVTTLSNKTWVVFNDCGEREVYIFQNDGTVFITNNGVGIKGNWQWVSANKSLIIDNNSNILMLHPHYIDNIILALTLDGTNNVIFLIEDQNAETFQPKSLSELERYFAQKEQLFIAEEKKREETERKIKEQEELKLREELKRLEEEKERLAIIELERQKRWDNPVSKAALEKSRKKMEEARKLSGVNEVFEKNQMGSFVSEFILSISCMTTIICMFLLNYFLFEYSDFIIYLRGWCFFGYIVLCFLVCAFLGSYMSNLIIDGIQNRKLKSYLKEHLEDPSVQYIIKYHYRIPSSWEFNED